MQRETARVDHGVQAVDHGSSQLKNQKDTHKGQDAAKQAEIFLRVIRCFFQPQGKKIGKSRGKEEQKAVGGVQIHVKGIACRQQENPPESGGHDMVQNKGRQQKDGKGDRIKKHSCLRASIERG